MREVFADLHVHLGRAEGRPIKIPSSPRLTLAGISATAARSKGVELVAVVDLWTDPARRELEEELRAGRWRELPEGGFAAPGGVTVLGGAELAVAVLGGTFHVVALFPRRESLECLAREIIARGGHTRMSTARFPGSLAELAEFTAAAGGIWYPAHAFTPHRGLYGAVDSLTEAFPAGCPQPAAVELGLSADTELASLPELEALPFLSNSDAHSLEKIGREANLLRLAGPSFAELQAALSGQGGRGIIANYGLDPRLGKYHRSFCLACGQVAGGPPPVLSCPVCGGEVVAGVADRIASLGGGASQGDRPPYHHQVPLEFLPGIGPRTATRLREALGGELRVLHLATEAELQQVAGSTAAAAVLRSRRGELIISVGGGGKYGRVSQT